MCIGKIDKITFDRAKLLNLGRDSLNLTWVRDANNDWFIYL